MIYLLITADDFGKNYHINRAISIAKKEGILTSASLMIIGERWEDAVNIAKNEKIDVGLHVSLTEGFSLYLNKKIDMTPTYLGISAQFSKDTFSWIKKEVLLQFEKFYLTGLPFSDVDSHHHIHIHPRLLRVIVSNCKRYGIKSIRFPYEPWDISSSISDGHRLRNVFYKIVFSLLSKVFLKVISSSGLVSPDGVFGLYRTGNITEDWFFLLLDRLCKKGKGIFEIYMHPEDKKESPGYNELKVLTSKKVKDKIENLGIRLISFSDLSDLIHI